ncbi:MAG: Gfo/Idh/MocA family oxidoreductase [Clostridia bacterium]|nr:Gfo/Idh/MocA family oxidoreductase [Clostridia bacterium]
MINIAIIGTGKISPMHIEGYLKFPKRCKIVALVDIYPEKAEQKKKEYKLDCEVLDSHKKLLGRKDIDLVSVCTPPFVHCEIAKDFLDDGKNVIIEKPMAASLDECDIILEAAEKSQTVLSVISQNRFRNPTWKLKKMLESGIAGKILHVQVDSFWWRGHCYYDLWWRGTWEKENGGCTLNHAVHHIDILNWMMNGLPEKVSAFIANVSHDNSEVEDLSSAILKYQGGAIGNLTSSVVHHGEKQKIIIQCEKTVLSMPWDPVCCKSREDGFSDIDKKSKKKFQKVYDAIPDLKFEGHTAQIDNVLTAIEKEQPPIVTGYDGKRALELIFAIYKSGSLDKIVNLPISPDDAFYTQQGVLDTVPRFHKKSGFIENFDDKLKIKS